MASGSFISNTGVNLNVYVVWSSTINVEGNYSTVYMDIYLRHYSLVCSAKSGSATADGSPQSFGTPSYNFGNSLVDTLMASKSFTVYHDSDGTKSCGLSAYWGFVGTYGGQSINGITAAATVTLDTIPRKSSISSLTPTVDVNGTNEVTVAISRASTSFTHKVTFSIGAYSQEYTGVATSKAFAIPMAWLNSIPNSVSGVANVRVETFSGATSLGYVDGAFTITAPATIIPTVTDIAFARDTTGTDPFTTYAKGVSKVNVSGISVTNQYSATTALFKTYLHLASAAYTTGILYNGSSFITAVIPSAGTIRLTTVVTDSRGRESVAYYEDFTVYDYFAPTLTVTAFRCNSAGIADPSGEYLSATMVVNVAPVNNNNTKTYVLEYKKTTDSTWTPISTAALTGYSGTLNAVRSASSANTWEVRASITDKVGTTTKATAVGTKRVPINSGFSGTAVAIGKVAETADLFEVDLAAKFNKAVTITGTLTAPAATPTTPGQMSAADKAYFENSKPVMLYDNATGSGTTLTLSETAENFQYMEIFYSTYDASPKSGSMKILQPNGNSTWLSFVFFNQTLGQTVFLSTLATISGTTISMPNTGNGYNGYSYFQNSPSTLAVPSGNPQIKIKRVVGYRW